MPEDHKIGSEPIRTRAFYPGDNPHELSSVDWKARYNELKNNKEWDPKKDFVGIKRLGDSYHPLDPFFKFEGVPDSLIWFDKIWYPTIGGFAGCISGALANWYGKRPFFSSILPTVLSTFFGMGLGVYAWKNSRRRARERDAVLIHYMLIHEKEFPRIERKRFGQIVDPWYPFRVGYDGLHVED